MNIIKTKYRPRLANKHIYLGLSLTPILHRFKILTGQLDLDSLTEPDTVVGHLRQRKHSTESLNGYVEIIDNKFGRNCLDVLRLSVMIFLYC